MPSAQYRFVMFVAGPCRDGGLRPPATCSAPCSRLEDLMPKQSILAVLLLIVCMFSASAWPSDWCDVRAFKASGETTATMDCAAQPKVYLDPQNEHRAQHCVPPLTWDEGLASQATAWARRCNFVHSFRSGVGENLFSSAHP